MKMVKQFLSALISPCYHFLLFVALKYLLCGYELLLFFDYEKRCFVKIVNTIGRKLCIITMTIR